MIGRKIRWWALAAAPVLLIAGMGAGSVYLGARDELARQRAAIDAGWAAVDRALRERADLVRDLAEVTRRFERHEDEMFREVADAHADLVGAATVQASLRANHRLTGVQARLLLAAEKYKRLGADRTFLQLQRDLKDNDEKIAVARRKYNETLEHYNARIQSFPLNLAARLAGFTRNDAYFHTESF